MSLSRKRPGAAFWATVVVVAIPLIYVLSFGPACWITSRSQMERLPMIYLPVGWAGMNGPDGLRTAICWYACVGMPHGSTVILPTDLSGFGTSLTPTR